MTWTDLTPSTYRIVSTECYSPGTEQVGVQRHPLPAAGHDRRRYGRHADGVFGAQDVFADLCCAGGDGQVEVGLLTVARSML